MSLTPGGPGQLNRDGNDNPIQSATGTIWADKNGLRSPLAFTDTAQELVAPDNALALVIDLVDGDDLLVGAAVACTSAAGVTKLLDGSARRFPCSPGQSFWIKRAGSVGGNLYHTWSGLVGV